MEAIALLRMQLQNAHQTLEGTLGATSQDDAHREPGGRAFKVAASYAHVIGAEDNIINGMFRQGAPLHASSWAGRTGISEPMPNPMAARQAGNWAEVNDAWCRRVAVDLPQARAYAQAVQASAEAYLGSLSSEDLDRPIDMSFLGMPSMPLGLVITMVVVGHYYCLAGEMSAVKGVHGLQGYPF